MPRMAPRSDPPNPAPFADIAARLRWHRAHEGLNQSDYAAAAGLKRAQLSNWESGQYRLSLDGALALNARFGLSLDFLYLGRDEMLALDLRRAWRQACAEGRAG